VAIKLESRSRNSEAEKLIYNPALERIFAVFSPA